MAFEDTLTAITNTVVRPGMHDQVSNRHALLKMLTRKGATVKGGDKIQVVPAYAHLGGGFYHATQEFDVSRKEFETAAYWDYCQAYAPMIVTGRDKIRNAGAARIRDFAKDMGEMASRTIRKTLVEGFLSIGSEAVYPHVDTLDHLIDDASGTLSAVNGIPNPAVVGGLDKSDDADWFAGNIARIYTVGGTTAGATQKLITKYGISPAHDGDIGVNLILMHSRVFDTLGSGLLSKEVFNDTTNFLAGFRVISINGVPCVADNHVSFSTTVPASNRVYCLNTDTIDLVTSSDANYRVRKFKEFEKQDVFGSQILWAGNLVIKEPRRNSVLYDFVWDSISET